MNVRERLRAEDPRLYAALEGSWETAQQTWLPLIAAKHGSHNAYPHLWNMELRLNDLAEVFGAEDRRPSFRLSPVEKYLLLAAVLFHDIGKARERYEYDHALGSYLLVEEHWAEYGILTDSLAHIVAKLALHHDVRKAASDPQHDARKTHGLSERTVDPYGRVRENGLSAVLVLLDHLDTSYTRVVPPEITQAGAKTFRKLVQGVEVDHEARLIRSVLAGFERKDALSPLPRDSRKLEYYALRKRYEDCYRPSDVVNHSLIRKVADNQAKFDDEANLSDHERLAVLQGNLRRNAEKLHLIRDNLHAMGIALDDWLLELDEHLFDSAGCEAWEPILDAPYLRRVAHEMWNLSTRVFGRAVFTYETLAAAVREPDVSRVKRAVRRLSILTDQEVLRDCLGNGTDEQGAVEAYDSTWRWRVSRPAASGHSGAACACVSIRVAKELLDTLETQRRGGRR